MTGHRSMGELDIMHAAGDHSDIEDPASESLAAYRESCDRSREEQRKIELKDVPCTHFIVDDSSVIVLRFKEYMTQNADTRIRGMVADAFPGRKVLILQGGASLEVVTNAPAH